MKNKIISMIVLAMMFFSVVLHAVTSEFRSPLTILRGPFHYPLAPVAHDIWSCNKDKIDDCPSLWRTDVWVTGYGRKADCSFYDCCRPTVCCTESLCDDNCLYPKTRTTTHTTSLAKLFFGKSTFRGEEAFANGMIPVTECTDTPALMYSKLSPRFDYNEHGAVFGLHAERKFNECSCWHFGARLYFPVKIIEVEQRRSDGSEVIEEDFGNVKVDYQQRLNPTDSTLANVYAYRLDFLSALCWIDGTPLIQYGDGTSLTTIANVSANIYSDWPKAESGVAPVSVIRANAEYLPAPKSIEEDTPDEPYPLARPIVQVGATGWELDEQHLNGAGSNGNNYDHLQFAKPYDYAAGLGLDREAQSKLFLVPNTKSQGGQGFLTQDGLLIQNKIEYLLSQLDLTERNSALQYFRERGVCFSLSDYITGIGDFDTEVYVGYGNECWYLDAIFGVRFPTGKKPDDIGRIYYQALGNKGHYEVKGALEGGWHPYECFALKYYLSYYYVMNARECRAPAFCGATVKNIPAGCPVKTDVKWSYFWGDVFMTFFHPNCQNCGATLGYELYAKTHDKVSLCSNVATDFFNIQQDLNPCILERNTKTVTHKILGELFHRVGYCELFGGGSWIIAGRDAMKELEWHIGAAIYF